MPMHRGSSAHRPEPTGAIKQTKINSQLIWYHFGKFPYISYIPVLASPIPLPKDWPLAAVESVFAKLRRIWSVPLLGCRSWEPLIARSRIPCTFKHLGACVCQAKALTILTQTCHTTKHKSRNTGWSEESRLRQAYRIQKACNVLEADWTLPFWLNNQAPAAGQVHSPSCF